MTTIEKMKQMRVRCFDEQHYKELQASYHELVKRGDFEEVEREYLEGKAALTSALNEQQATWLAEIEANYKENQLYAARYGFDAGLFMGFQRYFFKNPKDKCSIDNVLEDALFTMPQMQQHSDFYRRNNRCLELMALLEESLSDEVYYHITSVDCAWQERIHYFAVEQLYLGYRSAVSVLESVRPNATAEMVPDTLLIEYELGLLESNDRLEELARREREAKENG